MRLAHSCDSMKPKAILVLALSLIAPLWTARGQVGSNPAVPSVPRADGSGPSVPSMSPAVGDIPTPGPADAKPSNRSPDAPPPAELEAAAKASAARQVNSGATQSPTTSAKAATALPASKGRPLEGSPTVSVTGPSSPVSEVLDTTTLAQRIRDMPIADRGGFLDAFDLRIERSDRELNQLRQTSRQLKGDLRAAYLAADDDMKARHKALKRSLREARLATPEAWAKARTTLAADYEAYSVALVRMEASSAVGL